RLVQWTFRDHAGGGSGARAVGMRARAAAGRSNHSGQSPVFRTRPDGCGRTLGGAKGAQAWSAAGISVSAVGGLGAGTRRSRVDRTAQDQAVWHVHVGPFSTR